MLLPYLGLLVILILDAIDLLEQVTHPVHLWGWGRGQNKQTLKH